MRDGLRDEALMAAILEHKDLPEEEFLRRIRAEFGGRRYYLRRTRRPAAPESRQRDAAAAGDTERA